MAFAEFVIDAMAEFAEADTPVAKDSGVPSFDGAALTLTEADAEATVFAVAEAETLLKAFAIIGVL